MHVASAGLVFSLLLASSRLAAQGGATPVSPAQLLERAVERSGGEATLRAVTTARYEYTTTWYRTAFTPSATPPVGSLEQNVDIRDYGRDIWRYERRFGGPNPPVIDVVRDTVAIMDVGRGWQPLSGAYVQERREVFLYAPERLLVRALDAARTGTARRIADTAIAQAAHARIALAIDGIPVTLLLRASDAQLSGVRFRAAQPWDFGLAAWGEMDVDVWYGRWGMAGAAMLPFDVSIDRVGRPYKRLHVTRIQLNAPVSDDSVAVSDSLRRRYVAEQHRAMFDFPVDSIVPIGDGLSRFTRFGTPALTTQRAEGGVFYGAGAAALITGRSVDFLAGRGSPVRAAIVGTITVGGAGGAPELTRRGIAVFASVHARPFLSAMYAQQRVPITALHWVERAGWQRIAGDSLWLEPVDLPDSEGALAVWDPKRKLLYAGDALGAAQTRAVITLAAARGWPVESIYFRNAATPVAEVRRLVGL